MMTASLTVSLICQTDILRERKLIVVVGDGDDDSDGSASFDDEEDEGEDWDALEASAKRGKLLSFVKSGDATSPLTAV
jgi:hypothetical protein